MTRFGLHTSIAGGLPRSLERAHALGAECMQIFSHNPRGWKTTPISEEDASEFRALRAELGIDPVFIHTSYLLNIASPKEELREKSVSMLRQEMLRADLIGADGVVLHTGTAHDDDGVKRAATSIREVFREMNANSVLLLENTSGKRGDTTSTVEQLATLYEMAGGESIGFCLDTCHAYAAGYDLEVEEGIKKLSNEVSGLLPKGSVRLLHLNDSKGLHASGTDRHENIGQGNIGSKGLGLVLSSPVFKGVPAVLETPRKTDDDDIMNLKAARELLS